MQCVQGPECGCHPMVVITDQRLLLPGGDSPASVRPRFVLPVNACCLWEECWVQGLLGFKPDENSHLHIYSTEMRRLSFSHFFLSCFYSKLSVTECSSQGCFIWKAIEVSLYSEIVLMCGQMLLRSHSLSWKTCLLFVSDEHKDWQHPLNTWKQITSFKVQFIFLVSTRIDMSAQLISLLPLMQACTLLEPVFNETCVRRPIVACWVIFRWCVGGVLDVLGLLLRILFPPVLTHVWKTPLYFNSRWWSRCRGSVCRLPPCSSQLPSALSAIKWRFSHPCPLLPKSWFIFAHNVSVSIVTKCLYIIFSHLLQKLPSYWIKYCSSMKKYSNLYDKKVHKQLLPSYGLNILVS